LRACRQVCRGEKSIYVAGDDVPSTALLGRDLRHLSPLSARSARAGGIAACLVDADMTAAIVIAQGFAECDRAELVALLREYETSLGISLCFQGFEAELSGLPGDYQPPNGQILLARASNGDLVGCVAVRQVSKAARLCEMKRLYVRPAARGTGLGRHLAKEIMNEAYRLGYRMMCLDTLPSMIAAQSLYRSLGFCETENYNANPHPGTLFFERPLDDVP
jgi:putative acetyltransferase